MSMISEQVKELRELSEAYTACGHRFVGDKLREAADTIETLSAKLQAENMQETKSRNCKIQIPKLEHYTVLIGGHKILNKVSEERLYNGKFHGWFNGSSNENFPETKACGIVEYEDGTVHLIPMEYIVFTG